MQTLSLHLTPTPVDHVIMFAKRFGRTIINLATAPIERIARACDVGGVLEQRRADVRAPRPLAKSTRRHRRGCWSALFGGLYELT